VISFHERHHINSSPSMKGWWVEEYKLAPIIGWIHHGIDYPILLSQFPNQEIYPQPAPPKIRNRQPSTLSLMKICEKPLSCISRQCNI